LPTIKRNWVSAPPKWVSGRRDLSRRFFLLKMEKLTVEERRSVKNKRNGVDTINGRNMITAGLVGLALGVYLGNSMQKGTVTKQMRSTGRTVFKRAWDTVGSTLDNWIG
jgi:ribosomal protein S19